MYGAMRTRANNSTHLAGVATAILITTLAGYALANGFAMDLVRIIEKPITFTPLPDETIPDLPPPALDIAMPDTPSIDIPTLLPPNIQFTVTPDTPTITATRTADPGPTTNANVAPAPKPVRTRPAILPQDPPPYPTSGIRGRSEGVSRLEVCVDARGRVTSATLATSSGHEVLDNAALKWVRSARFTPGKLDGVPQSVCGHAVDYEWKLEDARR